MKVYAGMDPRLSLPEAITHAQQQSRPGKVCVKAERIGSRVRIDVEDNGPGIPPALHARLFQPFATAARAGGSGLGLAIARDLARAHGGDIALVASDASGTHFRVTIPDRSE